MKGASSKAVQELLGHADLKMTMGDACLGSLSSTALRFLGFEGRYAKNSIKSILSRKLLLSCG
jgi:hypothetical protein